MPLWLVILLALVSCFVTTFLVTWAIREGGSFAFLHPDRWRKRSDGKPPTGSADRGMGEGDKQSG